MTAEEYNYPVFDMGREHPIIDAFSEVNIHPGTRAPSFPLEDLASGNTVERL